MYLESLRSSSETMRVLLEDLLTLERIESERVTERQSFDLGSLVAEVVESQLAGARLKQQALHLERQNGLPPVQGSVTQLRQAVANLVGNAIKYTPEGGHIAVMVRSEQGRVAVSVKDDGYGISPARQARIFERFTERAAGTNTSAAPAGLSLVRQLSSVTRVRLVSSAPARQHLWVLAASSAVLAHAPARWKARSRTRAGAVSVKRPTSRAGGAWRFRQPHGDGEAGERWVGVAEHIAGCAAVLLQGQRVVAREAARGDQVAASVAGAKTPPG